MNKVEDQLILVNSHDHIIGYEGKTETHKKNLMHRAISIFIFNSKHEMLLQRRAVSKYHSGGLWSNACCSHPRKDETVLEASNRRLKEEMGLECPLKEIFFFTYKCKLGEQLFENEFDHVLLGITDNEPVPDVNEVEEWKWVNTGFLYTDVYENPDHYTYWFKLAFKKVLNHYFSEH